MADQSSFTTCTSSGKTPDPVNVTTCAPAVRLSIGGGGAGGAGGDGGRALGAERGCTGGGSKPQRLPQSMQSVPLAQLLYVLPAPPSSQASSLAYTLRATRSGGARDCAGRRAQRPAGSPQVQAPSEALRVGGCMGGCMRQARPARGLRARVQLATHCCTGTLVAAAMVDLHFLAGHTRARTPA